MRFLLLLLLLTGASRLHAGQIIVTLNPQDSVQIRRSLSDTALLTTRFHRIALALPVERQPDSTSLFVQFPFLRAPLYRIQWSQSLIPASLRAAHSKVYHFDHRGALRNAVLLADFDPERFAGGFEPYTIAAIDSIRTGNRMPASVSGLTVAGGRLYAIDNHSEQLVYLDQQAGDTLWNTVSFEALAPSAYQRFLKLGDSETLRSTRSFDSVFVAEGRGTLAGVTALSNRNDTLLVSVYHNYPTEFFLNNFSEVYELVGNQVVGSAIVTDPAAHHSDSVQRIATAQYRDRLTTRDSLAYLAQFTAYINGAAAAYRQRFPQGYSPSSQVFRNDTGAYLIRATPNQNSYRFIGVFNKRDRQLRPSARMLRVEKGEIHKASQNYRMSSPLTGRYPYLMDPISNVLYDLERDIQIDLPLELGNYDLSEAAMKTLKLRTELFVFDVFVEDGIARVLYVSKHQAWPRLLVYDLARRTTLRDDALYSLSIRGRCLLKFADAGSFFVARADGGTLQLVSLN